MNPVLAGRLSALRRKLDVADMYLGSAVLPQDLVALCAAVDDQLEVELPREYAEFLMNHDGIVAAGVVLYSSRAHPFSDSEGHSPAFVEQNHIARELGFMRDFLVFGESDQDEYVLDLSSMKYQVRDRQVFDNVFEEFTTFDGLLEHIINLIEQLA